MEYCVFTEPQQGATYDDQLRFAQAAERLGFTGYFRSDHYLSMGDWTAGGPGPTDAWTTLAGLARETKTLRLGTLVSSVTYRVPGILAIQVAQVDHMSGGRVELGLGTGWFEREHSALSIPFPPKRFGMLEEQLEIVTSLWALPEGETYTFEGTHYSLTDAPGLPKPVQAQVPVIVGGGGPSRTPALAARFASEFNIGFVAEPVIREKFEGVRAAAEAIDRDPDSLKYSAALPTLVGASTADLERHAAAIGTTVDAFANDANVFGTAQQAIDKVGRVAELGAGRLYFQILDMRDLDQLEYLGTEVLPHLP